jgi:hypothetical protein
MLAYVSLVLSTNISAQACASEEVCSGRISSNVRYTTAVAPFTAGAGQTAAEVLRTHNGQAEREEEGTAGGKMVRYGTVRGHMHDSWTADRGGCP